MKVQVLTSIKDIGCFEGKNVTERPLHDPEIFDEYDINVIDLNCDSLWRCEEDIDSRNSKKLIDQIADIESLGKQVADSKKSKTIIMLPQNFTMRYCYNYYINTYGKEKPLKDLNSKLELLIDTIAGFDAMLMFGHAKTKVGKSEMESDFYFDETEEENIYTKTTRSNRPTTIKEDEVYFSTLQVDGYDDLIALIDELGLIKAMKEDEPEWIKEKYMFSDAKQHDLIFENEQIIKESQKEIEKAEIILAENSRLKSIMYTQGDELVEVVFEILEDMAGWDFSGFKDVHNEDFLVEYKDHVFIGEIKGVSSNVKNGHVSQLEVHVSNYLDDHPDKTGSISALLIMDHQRTIPLDERKEIHQTQIDLAKRNGSLIIDTYTLLKLYEKYRDKKITRKEINEMFIEKTGLLKI